MEYQCLTTLLDQLEQGGKVHICVRLAFRRAAGINAKPQNSFRSILFGGKIYRSRAGAVLILQKADQPKSAAGKAPFLGKVPLRLKRGGLAGLRSGRCKGHFICRESGAKSGGDPSLYS